jgi:hypothetical protein
MISSGVFKYTINTAISIKLSALSHTAVTHKQDITIKHSLCGNQISHTATSVCWQADCDKVLAELQEFAQLAVQLLGARGGAVDEALRYKPEGRVIDSRWRQNFYWHNPFGRTMVLGLNQPLTGMCTRNISWGEDGRCVGLTTLPHSCADCLKIWEIQSPGTLGVSQGF